MDCEYHLPATSQQWRPPGSRSWVSLVPEPGVVMTHLTPNLPAGASRAETRLDTHHLLFQVTCSRCSFPPCPACTLVYHCSCQPVCTLPAAEVDADLARSPLMPWSRYRNHLNKKHLCKSMIISILNSLNAVYISRVRVRRPWCSEACCLSKNYS